MLQKDNVISIKKNQVNVKLNPKARDWVVQCKKIFSDTLFRCFEQTLGQVDDVLFALADKADNSVSQSMYFDAMREVRKHRKSTEKRFQARWSACFNQFWETGEVPFAQAPPDDSSEFALVDESVLEENLAIEGMISKGDNLYHSALEALNSRITLMLHGTPVNNTNNPFSPFMICHIYHEVGKDILIDIKIKLVLSKLVERHLISQLGDAYDAVNDQLEHFGVKAKPSDQVKPSRQAAPQAVEKAEHVVDQKIQAELFNSMQQLLSVRRNALGQEAVSGPSYQAEDVVQALSNMQSTGAQEPGGSMLDVRALLLSEVQKLKSDHSGFAIGQGESDTLDVVNMIFEFIIDDRNLPDAMKALLSRLQIPMLKVGILDKRFFSQTTHPARRLLNELAQAGLGWNPQEGQGENTLYGQIALMVRRITEEFDDRIELFDELLEAFLAFTQKEGRFAEVAEKRANQLTLGREKLDVAKGRAAQEIAERLSAYYVPDAIQELIESGWKDVLLLAYLRNGLESPEWQGAVQTMESLIWTCQPKEVSERQEMMRIIPSLLKQLREGLTLISFDAHKMASLLKDLQAYHIDVLRGLVEVPTLDAAQVIVVGKNPDGDVEEIVIGEQVETGAVAVSDEFVEQAALMAVGTWLEYVDESTNKVRCKLSCRTELTKLSVLVNRRGIKVAELSLHGLASILRRPTTTVLENVPLMDRAMSALMGSLKGE